MSDEEAPEVNKRKNRLAITKQQRSTSKANISRINKLLENEAATWNTIDLECRLEILNSYIRQIMAYQTEIEKADPEDDKRGEIEELCISTKSKLLALIGGSRKSESTIVDTSFNMPIFGRNRLPNLKLPSFSGKYSEYTAFITSFKSLVHNESTLPTIEKFNHLLTCLSGDALKTVQAFQVSEENYSKALNRLAERYDKKCLIFFDNIEQMVNLPKIEKPDASMIRHSVDTMSAIYDSLSSIGSDKDILNALLIHLVISKVDPSTRTKWNDKMDHSVLPTWNECSQMLIRRCQSIETDKKTSPKQTQSNASHKQNITSYKNKAKSTLTCAQANDDPKCHHCKSKNHYMQNCEAFIALPVATRFDNVKKYGLCINCLRKGHSVSSCKSSRCRVCQRPHNTLLHKYEIPSVSASIPTPDSLDLTQRSSLHCQSNEDMIILATAIIQIKDKYGDYQLARAILDSGSQINLISEETAQRLQLKRERDTINIIGVGQTTSNVKQKVSASMKSRTNNFKFDVDLWIIKSIASHQPESNIAVENWNIPPNIELADPCFYKKQKIDLLLGAETFFELLSIGQIKLHDTLPTLQKTMLGWIISGKYTQKTSTKTCNLAQQQVMSLPDIDATLRQFWEIEEVSAYQSHLTAEQKNCESHFAKTTKLLPIGRFEVRLPFKLDPNTLGTSFDNASRRFFALERRMLKTPDVRKMYHDFMKEYLDLGHMERINSIPSSDHYFIPHQCVLRMQSTSTKLRVVFDASAKTSTHVSLNDALMVGPTIQPDLYTILLRFRLYKYAVTADIAKMYRQVLVNVDDRKFQLIVWREHANMPLQIYRLNTVTYGTASAPFLAIRCLTELSKRYKEEFPIGAKVLNENFYVDDMLYGADTVEDLISFQTEIVAILKKANFELAKWFSNYQPIDSNGKLLKANEHDLTRTLGITWDHKQDVFRFNILDNFHQLKATKRNILSVAARLFDPLGLLCPIIVNAKIIIQNLWLQKLDWDESIPMNLATSWESFQSDLKSISKISIQRFVHTSRSTKVEIHGFSDASMRAYGCCIYIRQVENDNVTTHLLTAKSKVAPVKTKTLPRLELCAAHLLAKLWKAVQTSLEPYVSNVTFWTDSEIVLYWLKSHASTLSTFVGNRVAEIQDLCGNITWRHVPTKENPADLTSRGCTTNDLINNRLWFFGPKFLEMAPSMWPVNTKFEVNSDNSALELRKQKTALLDIKKDENIILTIIEDCSSYPKILRIVAYVYRFLQPNKKYQSAVVSPEEYDWAFLKIVSIIQQNEFANEIQLIEKSSSLKNNLQKLTPFVHQYSHDNQKLKLLRVGGRLLNAPLSFETKFPLLLTKHSTFVMRYISHLHFSNCHAGPKALVGLMRQKVWIVNAREVARKVVRSCIHCFKYKPKLMAQVMGNLPLDRLRSLRPFLICGVDFCGPFQTSHRIRGRQPYKTYASIFVCFSSKAIHIELVSDLSTNSFISILKRFIARRGLPQKIYCDNATNFVGANNKLRELRKFFLNTDNQQEFENYASQRGIEFVFIPPRSPHFGGLWEAGVKSTKNLLYRTVGNANLTYEELLTVLNEIEAILNSRPIGALSDDPNDGDALTPAHLLIGQPLNALPEMPDSKKLSTLKRFELVSTLKRRFWTTFQREFILTQQCRNKWSKIHSNIDVGALVMIHEDNLPSQHWRIGRVISATLGSDGKARVADVKTTAGTFRRAVHKLAVLPLR